MGNQGIDYYYYKAAHKRTNSTGYADFITPVGGLLWAAGEDWLDLHAGKKMRRRRTNPGMLLLSSLVTPVKSGASILRYKPPWDRDSEHHSSIEPQD